MRGGVPLWTQTELIPSVKREENIEREQQRLWKTKPLSSLLWWKFQSACHYSDTHTVCAVSWWYAISASFILIACTRKSAFCQRPHDTDINCLCDSETTADKYKGEIGPMNTYQPPKDPYKYNTHKILSFSQRITVSHTSSFKRSYSLMMKWVRVNF